MGFACRQTYKYNTMYTIKASCPHALGTKSRLMSDIHSTITTTAGCLFYQLVSFAFEVSLRKSVQISLIAVAGSAHKVRLKQCHVRRALLVQSRFPIVLARRLKCWPIQLQHWTQMLMNSLFHLPQLPIFVLGK